AGGDRSARVLGADVGVQLGDAAGDEIVRARDLARIDGAIVAPAVGTGIEVRDQLVVGQLVLELGDVGLVALDQGRPRLAEGRHGDDRAALGDGAPAVVVELAGQVGDPPDGDLGRVDVV